MSIESWTLVIAVLAAVSCGLCGSLLVVSRQAMVSEGLSHAVLPGLVLAFIFFRSFESPWLIASAAVSGLLMVLLTKALAQTRLVDPDAGLGLVFAGMFSVGILLVSVYLKNSYFHADCIVDGNLAIAALNRVDLPWVGRVPKSFITSLINLVAIGAFILVGYKQLKAMIFDPTHAAQVGLRPTWWGYGWIALVSLTTVAAFDVSGSVLIVALMIAPPAAAFLLTRRFAVFLLLSMVIASVSAVVGFYVARYLDISPTGPIASTAGFVFLIIFIANPVTGLVAQLVLRRRRRTRIMQLLACELVAGCHDSDDAIEQLCRQLNLPDSSAREMFDRVLASDWIQRCASGYAITDSGRQSIDREIH